MAAGGLMGNQVPFRKTSQKYAIVWHHRKQTKAVRYRKLKAHLGSYRCSCAFNYQVYFTTIKPVVQNNCSWQ